MRHSVLLLLAIALAACGGGGGGGSTQPPPTVASAAFVGAGATAVPGDLLILFTSRDVTLVAGALLDDADLALAGGSLGTVTAAPVLLTPRAVQITLGTGVAVAPSSVTVAFGPGNDAVKGTDGVLASGGTPVAISAGDGTLPLITALTLSGVHQELNGSGAAGGVLQVPRGGFTIDAGWFDASPIDPQSCVISASVAVGTPSGTVAAGQSLTAALSVSSSSATGASFLVPAGVTFPDGALTLTFYARDATGMTSAPATFIGTVKGFSDALQPFETSTHATQLWYLDLTRDIEAFNYSAGTPLNPITNKDGGGNPLPANGRADLDDLWLILGLHGSSSSVNATVSAQLQARILAELATLFSGVKVTFTFSAPGSFPASSTVPYAAHPFSRICIAGAEDETGTSGVLGVAIFDPHNETQDDDCQTAFAGVQRLGVFLHTLVNAGMRPPSSSLFRTTYDPFTSVFGGTPIGNDVQDASRLADVLQDTRAATIDTALDRLARVIAVITAHECGHSMGLVQDGAMPAGLYGGDPVHFPGSTSGHIRNDAQFPAGAQNVMSPAIGFETAVSAQTAFNTLNLAYLRERVLYN